MEATIDYIGKCPTCKESSRSVCQYKLRTLKHFTIGGISERIIPYATYRCHNEDCACKTFTYYAEVYQPELCGKSIYSQSSHDFVVNKLLKHPISYNSLKNQINDDFDTKTSICTIYTWLKKVSLVAESEDLSEVSVLNTDEKHPFKKK